MHRGHALQPMNHLSGTCYGLFYSSISTLRWYLGPLCVALSETCLSQLGQMSWARHCRKGEG